MASQLQTTVTTSDGATLTLNTGLFIDNKFVESPSTIDTVNPSTEKVIASVHAADAKLVDAAVEAADKAFRETWRDTAPLERAKLLYKLADLVDRDAEELARIETMDNGKPYSVARLEMGLISSSLRYYSGWCDKHEAGKVIETKGTLSYTRHEPLGVCGAITPWNFPLVTFVFKMAPALCTGNTFVGKSSEITPLSAIKLGSLVKEAGFPPGVVNILTGYGPVAGDALARHPKVAMVSFTGSTAVGRKIMTAASESNLKKVTLELGGKSPNIIFDDVQDLDKAVEWAHMGIFYNAGQVCCAGSRIFVQEGIYDAFLEKFSQRAKQGKLGDPYLVDTTQGPQVSQAQYDRIMGYIQAGKDEGATVYLGGNRHGDKGYFIEPTIFTDTKTSMKIMQEEIFGPVVAVTKFKDTDDVLEKAHDTIYGLAAGVFTSSIDKAILVSNALQAGTVWVNCYNQLSYQEPFGGYGQSGIGRENGIYGLQEYIQVKTVKINVSKPAY